MAVPWSGSKSYPVKVQKVASSNLDFCQLATGKLFLSIQQ